MTSSCPRAYRQAVRGVNCVNPASWSAGRIRDLISLLTTELFIDCSIPTTTERHRHNELKAPVKGQTKILRPRFPDKSGSWANHGRFVQPEGNLGHRARDFFS